MTEKIEQNEEDIDFDQEGEGGTYTKGG